MALTDTYLANHVILRFPVGKIVAAEVYKSAVSVT